MVGILSRGALVLSHFGGQHFATWHCSKRTKFGAVDVHLAGGVEHAFSIVDPALGRTPLLRAQCADDLVAWLQKLRGSVAALRASSAADELATCWSTSEHGVCHLSWLPRSVCDTWSQEVPVQAADAGEVVIEDAGAAGEAPTYAFLGVVVQPLVGLLARSVGVTFTPRFVVQNKTDFALQLLPALLAPDQRKWQTPAQAGRGSIAEPTALWLPPKENIALFHFPLWCQAREAHGARKAICMRLAGRAQLELRAANDESLFPLEQVFANFMPYRDAFCQFGPLPQALRVLVREGRLQCLRGYQRDPAEFGGMALNVEADVFAAVPAQQPVPPWLRQEPWRAMGDAVELRLRGRRAGELKVFCQRAQPGMLSLSGLSTGSIIMFAQTLYRTFGELDSAEGLPWSRWVSLDTTGNGVHDLSGPLNVTHFVRCSVQVEQSTAYLVLSRTEAPYRVENRSPSRTVALMFQGSRSRCRVLPPLSWCAFDWPDPTVRARKLFVHDVSTSKRGMYDADAIGPGSPLDVTEAALLVTGATAPITEDGYHSVLLLLDPREMREFVRRVVQSMGGRSQEEASLVDFAKNYSGERASLSLRTMRRELIATGMVPRPVPVLTEQGCQEAAICEVTMIDFLRAVVAAGGLTALDESRMLSVARLRAAHPSLQQIIEEVANASWAQAKQPVDISYELAVSKQDAVGIQLCMWRVLRESKAIGEADGRAVAEVAASIAQDLLEGRSRPWREVAELAMSCAGGRGRSGIVRLGPDMATAPTQSAGGAAAANGAHDDGMGSIAGGSDIGDDRSMAALATAVAGDGLEVLSSSSGGSRRRSLESDTGSFLAVASSEPITEEGYFTVASLRFPAAMAKFVGRVIEDEGGKITKPGRLPAFARWYSGERSAVQSLARLREELATQDWVRFGTGGAVKLYVDRWHDGVTKVLTLSEGRRGRGTARSAGGRQHEVAALPSMEWWHIDVQLAGLHLALLYESSSHVLGTGFEASAFQKDEEVLAVTADHFRFLKVLGQQKVELSLHHFQIDNMREADRPHPIIIAPLDSGYQGHRREVPWGQKLNHNRNAPSFLYIAFEQLPSNILHIRELQFIMKPVTVRLDLVFWLEVGKMAIDWLPRDSTSSGEDAAITEKYITDLCTSNLEVPSASSTSNLMLLELLRIGAVISQVEILMPVKSQLNFGRGSTGQETGDMADNDDDQQGAMSSQSVWLVSALSRVTFRSQGLLRQFLSSLQICAVWTMQTIGTGLMSGVGHVTPKFSFPETMIMNEFGDRDVFLMNLIRGYVKSGLKQCWRVLFSTNLLGDPIGFATSVGGSIVQFARKTGSEIYSGDLRGEGVAVLANGVVGGVFGHAGKLFGAFGDTIDAIAQTGDDRHHLELGNVSHVGDGVAVGLTVFAHSTMSGLVGVVERPVEGFQQGGVAGLGKGVLRGLGGLVFKPMSGLLHGVQHIAEGVQVNVQHVLGNSQQICRRREPRHLCKGIPREPLNCSVFSPSMTLFVGALKTDSAQLGGATFCVHLSIVETSSSSSSERVLWSKRTRLGRVGRGCVVFEEVKWCPTQYLLNNSLVIEIQDYALGLDPENPETVYKAKLTHDTTRPEAVLSYVANVLRHPEKDEHLHRLRPKEVMRVGMQAVGRPCTGPRGELLLKFWPSWDPDTVPFTQRWIENRGDGRGGALLPAQGPEQPPRLAGFLEKRSRGAFHHWSTKWVVIADREFRYWNDKRRYDLGQEPKTMLRLAEANCPFRFAAGSEGGIFLQVHVSGQIEARWRVSPKPSGGGTSDGSDAAVAAAGGGGVSAASGSDEWLQVILLNCIPREPRS